MDSNKKLSSQFSAFWLKVKYIYFLEMITAKTPPKIWGCFSLQFASFILEPQWEGKMNAGGIFMWMVEEFPPVQKFKLNLPLLMTANNSIFDHSYNSTDIQLIIYIIDTIHFYFLPILNCKSIPNREIPAKNGQFHCFLLMSYPIFPYHFFRMPP